VLALSCECGGQDAGPDAGSDGGRDGGRDAGDDAGTDGGDGGDGGGDAGHDAGDDAGPLAAFPGGWERIPWMPEWCDAWRPRGEAAGAVPPLRYEPCDPPEAGCEELVVDWERSRIHRNYFIAGTSYQITGGRFVALRVTRFIEDLEYSDSAIYRLDGTPVAVFRTRRHEPSTSGIIYCNMRAVAATSTELVLAFWVTTGRYETTGDDDDYSVLLLRGDAAGLQRSDDILFDLEVSDLLAVGNVPSELHYDGSTVIVQGPFGVYLGSLAGGPWGEVATGRTGDLGNAGGHLFDGVFYWSSVPVDGSAWGRVRRRRVDGGANETFFERSDGYLGSFRTDGRWAAWAHHADDDPRDGRLDRTDIWAARVDGALDEPDSWPATRLTSVDYPNMVDPPILHDGLYAYLITQREFEMVDLVRSRKLRIRTAPGTWWVSFLHLSGDYLFLVHQDPSGTDGMRRYDLDAMEGWEDL